MLLFFLNILRSSYQNELDNFFGFFENSFVPVRAITKGAISLARKKLKHSAFIDLNKRLTEHFYKNKYKKWYGFRLLAIDGSTLMLPKTKDTKKHFGIVEKPNSSDKTRPVIMAIISQCFDLLNKIVIDSAIGHYNNCNETDMAFVHMKKLNSNDLLLADRGYGSFFLLKNMISNNISFCFRVKTNWNIVKEFLNSNKKDGVFELKPTRDATKKCNYHGLNNDPIMVRLVKVKLKNGDIEVLLTSLYDSKKYPNGIFKKLYFLRWGVEESYKHLKHRIEIENFSGKSALAVRQDFYAKVFMVNFTEMLSKPAIEEIEKENKNSNNKHKYQINRTQALAKMKTFFMPIILANSLKYLTKTIADLMEMFIKDKEVVREDREFERRTSRKNRKKFPICFKSIL